MLRQWSKCACTLVQRVWFPVLWSFIAAVSAFDTFLTIRFEDLMSVVERNAVGRFLIDLDNGGIGLFVRTKIAGTVIVLIALVALHLYQRRWARPVTIALAAFQFGLLSYLALSEPALQKPATEVSAELAASLPAPRTVWDDIAWFLPHEEPHHSHTR
ncbi:MAG: hypothetical protein JSS02_08720 [Planctomycetes bacterium]|nr:hypothetical protein [Planctomycetota bacterium]